MKVKTTVYTILLAASLTAAAHVNAATYSYASSAGVMYDVTVLAGDFSLIESELAGSDTWLDNDLSRDLAELGGCQGDGNLTGSCSQGPLFAAFPYPNVPTKVFAAYYNGYGDDVTSFDKSTVTQWAYATEVAAVPLPAAAWLFISALGGLVVAKRRQPKA